MSDARKKLNPILPNPPRWEPHPDPTSIEVPGLDSSAPVNDQIDQMEQLITIKLQNIDANFSKIQNILSTRILPAFKRYSVGTEPVREAAKFWTSFYEQAAQIRLPTYDDYSSLHEQQPEDESQASTSVDNTSKHTSEAVASHPPRAFDPNKTPSDSSFMPAQGAISSTPATVSRYHGQSTRTAFPEQNSESSWAASLESPLIRMERDLQDLARDDAHSVADISDSYHDQDTIDETIHASTNRPTSQADITQQPVSPNKGKSRQQIVRDNLLRQALDPQSIRRGISPLRLRKPKTPVAASHNPYLPPGTQPHEWSGVVDLRDPSITTPQRSRHPVHSEVPITSSSAYNAPNRYDDDDDDDDDLDLPPGMSPPVMMEFARLPKLGRTPGKEAAARIGKDLIGNAQRIAQPKVYSNQDWRGVASNSSIPSPPSLTKYTPGGNGSMSSSVVDSTFESMMNRVGANIPGGYRPSMGRDHEQSTSSASSAMREYVPSTFSNSRHTPSPPAPMPATFSADEIAQLPPSALQTPDQQRYDIHHMQDDSGLDAQDADSSIDSMDSMDYEVHDTAHPSAAFLLASRQRGRNDDDSFESDDTDGDDLEDGAEPVHPFARAAAGVVDDGFDDSFDDSGPEEETVFGMRPAERAARDSEAAAMARFRMHGVEPVQDTIGIAQSLDALGKSPTPWTGQRGDLIG